MSWNWRRSTKLGPFRLTASKSGTSVSPGNAVHRVTRNSRGRTTSTWRIPGTGICWRSSKKR